MNAVTKAAVSVSEMARMVGLSRARFYQLMNEGIMPKPTIDPSICRPYFDELSQQSCLEVRRRNCGVNGKRVMFYPARTMTAKVAKKQSKPSTKLSKQHVELIESLASLGLTVTSQQVETALQESYPNGVADTDHGTIVRTLFLFIKRQN